jgi:hypothetical protein
VNAPIACLPQIQPGILSPLSIAAALWTFIAFKFVVDKIIFINVKNLLSLFSTVFLFKPSTPLPSPPLPYIMYIARTPN